MEVGTIQKSVDISRNCIQALSAYAETLQIGHRLCSVSGMC